MKNKDCTKKISQPIIKGDKKVSIRKKKEREKKSFDKKKKGCLVLVSEIEQFLSKALLLIFMFVRSPPRFPLSMT